MGGSGRRAGLFLGFGCDRLPGFGPGVAGFHGRVLRGDSKGQGRDRWSAGDEPLEGSACEVGPGRLRKA
jgi:hypothetical protein